MVHDEYLSGRMDRRTDGQRSGQERLRWGWGSVSRACGCTSWLDGRTQDPPTTPTLSQTLPPPPPQGPAASSQSSCGSHSQGPPQGPGQGILPTPYLPLAILFDTPDDSAQNFCRGSRVGSECWVLWPRQAPEPSGRRGWASTSTPVYFCPQSCEVTPGVTPGLQAGKHVERTSD